MEVRACFLSVEKKADNGTARSETFGIDKGGYAW